MHGGIFGIAGFVDHCMDAWMADPVLNANDAVATWHGRAQRCGFKFLVTQLMGYLCGGPQVYTGTDMAASHKHLNISEEEWKSFIDALHEVCGDLGLPQQEVDDVTAVIESMRADCIIQDGETPPSNPGHAVPPGDLLYARCGGVYPLALMCDRLVDAMLTDESVNIAVDATRTMASLKYCFTELCCANAGGLETMTAPSVAATMLRLSPSDFVKLLGSVAPSADHLDTPELGVELAQLLYGAMDLVLKEPPKWDERTWEHQKAAPSKTHREWRTGAPNWSKVGCPVFYVPDGKGGFLLPMAKGADATAAAQLAAKHGFAEAAAWWGCTSPANGQGSSLHDRHLYSMDEIAGYEEGMNNIDQQANKALTKRLDKASRLAS